MLKITGVIGGNDTVTLRKDGPGLLVMNAANGYAGATIVAAGTLEIQAVGALGLASKGTTVVAGATLQVETGGTITEPLTLIGDDVQGATGAEALLVGQSPSPGTPRSPFRGCPCRSSSCASPTWSSRSPARSAARRDSASWDEARLWLTGPSSNTYAGRTYIWMGEAVLKKNAGAVAVPAGLTVGASEPGLVAEVTANEHNQIQGAVTIDETGHLVSGWNDTIGALTMIGGKVSTTGTGTLTLGGNITVLQSAQTAVIAGQLSLGNDSRTIDVQSTANPGVDIAAVIGSPIPAGLIKTGAGIARLGGANTYTGLTLISVGTHRAGTSVGAGAWSGDEHQARRPSLSRHQRLDRAAVHRGHARHGRPR